jgi:hypothetical protein
MNQQRMKRNEHGCPVVVVVGDDTCLDYLIENMMVLQNDNRWPSLDFEMA